MELNRFEKVPPKMASWEEILCRLPSGWQVRFSINRGSDFFIFHDEFGRFPVWLIWSVASCATLIVSVLELHAIAEGRRLVLRPSVTALALVPHKFTPGEVIVSTKTNQLVASKANSISTSPDRGLKKKSEAAQGIGGRGKEKLGDQDQNDKLDNFIKQQDQTNQTLLQAIQSLTAAVNNIKSGSSSAEGGHLERSGGGEQSRTSNGHTHKHTQPRFLPRTEG
ncbi:hypothetical protein SUGI_0837210 [Cryptomeria japonica]|nr:hypothetical protein SUGI_0837210 [Cryptomeria japonica]